MSGAGEILTRWSASHATTTGVRLVRVRRRNESYGAPWRDVDRWAHYESADLFTDKDAALADGERRRTERRDALRRQLEKLNRPMRVVEKLKAAVSL